jgi:hypothetical protein
MIESKQPVAGHLVKLLVHKRLDRGMRLIPESSRCVRRYEIHELVATDQRDLGPGSTVDRVAFLGFAEFSRPGVVERGDELWMDGAKVGTVAGFDACHHPNHYNIIVESPRLAAGGDLGLVVGANVVFKPSAPAASAAPPTVIVGLGRAGKGLHLPCIKRARQMLFGAEGPSSILVFDPHVDIGIEERAALHQATRVDDLAAIPRADRERAVVHVCTPPRVRGDVLETASAMGMRRFVIEKPMASSPAELDGIVALAGERDLDIVVVSSWTASALTDALKRAIEAVPGSELARVFVSQAKSRISRSRVNPNHESALDVELPHMLGLVHALCEPPLHLRRASCWDMRLDGVSIRDMGGVSVLLETPQGCRIELHADHMAPFRERKICIALRDGSRLEGFYPCTSADLYSQLHTYDPRGELLRRDFLEDDTLTRFFIEAYRHFEACGPRPCSDLPFNVSVYSLLNEIRRRCVPSEDLVPLPSPRFHL